MTGTYEAGGRLGRGIRILNALLVSLGCVGAFSLGYLYHLILDRPLSHETDLPTPSAPSIESDALRAARGGEAAERKSLRPLHWKFNLPAASLAVVGFIQNESPFLEEWIEHYREEGAVFFVILEHEDHEAEQRNVASILEPYIDAGIAELHKVESVEKGNTQVVKYNEVALPILKERGLEWALTVDVDEYVYGRFGKSFAEALAEVTPERKMVCIPWKMFTTMGSIWEPRCVVPFHVHRRPASEALTYVKCAHRVKDLHAFAIHGQYRQNGEKTDSQARATEQVLESLPWHLNHYRAHSVEHHFKKRSKQGRPTGMPMNGKGNKRDFQRGWSDKHTLLWDVELAMKQSWKGLGCTPSEWDGTIEDFNDMMIASDGNQVIDLEEIMCPRQESCPLINTVLE